MVQKDKEVAGKVKSKCFICVLALALTIALSAPAYALKVYSNPSIQTGNTSPDGTYNEAYAMQTVSDYFCNKCSARGFATRDSNWLSLSAACNDAVNWDADAFVSEHTNASGGGGWSSTHGTMGLYYKTCGGWYDWNDYDLCKKCVDQCINQFAAFGRGAMWGSGYYGDCPFYGYHLYVLSHTPGMNAVLIEGLFHTNWDDVQVLKTDAGKQAYAEGLYRGVCDHYGYSYGTLDSQYNAQSYQSTLHPGEQAIVWAEYKNTGSVTWTNSGSNPVRLGTWNPQDRSSVFYTAGNWVGPNRPTNMDQSSVGAGSIGRFTFIMTGPYGNYGYFQEYWRLVKELVAWFGYDGVWFGVNVVPYDTVLDNAQAGFTCSGNWNTGTMSSDKYGADYRWRSTEAVSDPAKWEKSLPASGSHKVYAWWTQGGNRTSNIAYIVFRDGGSNSVYVNQQVNGGQWNYLGQWSMSTGKVWLSCWATPGYVVIADAVRWVGPY